MITGVIHFQNYKKSLLDGGEILLRHSEFFSFVLITQKAKTLLKEKNTLKKNSLCVVLPPAGHQMHPSVEVRRLNGNLICGWTIVSCHKRSKHPHPTHAHLQGEQLVHRHTPCLRLFGVEHHLIPRQGPPATVRDPPIFRGVNPCGGAGRDLKGSVKNQCRISRPQQALAQGLNSTE